jgi:hypothetical protein
MAQLGTFWHKRAQNGTK